MNIYLNGLTASRSNVYSNDDGNPNHPTAKRSNVYKDDNTNPTAKRSNVYRKMATYVHTTPKGSHIIANITFLQTCNPFGIKTENKYIA